MIPDPPTITMTSFAGFIATDPSGQLAKVREIKRRYEQEYKRGSDFWPRWIEAMQKAQRGDGQRPDLSHVWRQAPDGRDDQYRTASEGFGAFWGRKKLQLLGFPRPVEWKHKRLRVRVNPEWWLSVNGRRTLVKLHTTRDVVLTQRMANPLLQLLKLCFPGDHDVLILDVHRGKAWKLRTSSDLEPVLRMQAGAFLEGWDAIFGSESEAA